MNIPRLMLVADGFASGRGGRDAEQMHQCVAAATRNGVGWVQLRDHEADPDTFEACARALTDKLRARSPDVLISINSNVEVARELKTGLHVGSRGPGVAQARAELGDGLLTVSIHDPEEAPAAVADGADALVFAPVYETGSKPGHPGSGVDALAETCRLADGTPVIALGGMHPDRVRACLDVGAYGIAVLSAILDASPAAMPVVVSAFFHALRDVSQ